MNEDVWSSIIEKIYHITGCREDYINPTMNGEMIWRSVCSYDTNYEMLWKDGRISCKKSPLGAVHKLQKKCVGLDQIYVKHQDLMVLV
jgi:hypothetical protein